MKLDNEKELRADAEAKLKICVDTIKGECYCDAITTSTDPLCGWCKLLRKIEGIK